MRIGSLLSGADLAAQHHLLQAFARSQRANTRLATMIRINRGSDDPAGLIAMEQLEAELTAIRAASDNAARAGGVVHVADAALGEVNGLLSSIRANVVQAAGGGLSDAEIDAKQIEVDAALEAVDRIGSYTSFNGQKLLDGDRLTFNFSPDAADPVTLDMPNVNTSALGGAGGLLSDLASGGPASLQSGNLAEAIDVLDAAGAQILDARARLGAFEKHTIESTARVLGGMERNLASAKSLIGDADVAEETSRRTAAAVMVQAAVSTVALAGQRHRGIGRLLG